MAEENLNVEVGATSDVTEAQGLIGGARRWLRARSIDQWQIDIPDSVIRADADRGGLFVVRTGAGLAAMVALSESDIDTWGDDGQPAMYVHRLVVAQDQRGTGLGSRLLKWACDRAATHGASAIRLDCATDNPGLRRFYEREGFAHVRDVVVPAPDESRLLASSLYQRSTLEA